MSKDVDAAIKRAQRDVLDLAARPTQAWHDIRLLAEEVVRLQEFERFLREQAREFGPSASLAASLAEWDGLESAVWGQR